jgi:hypothetical protein
MSISVTPAASAPSAPSASGAGGNYAARIQKLQEQLQEAMEELKEAATDTSLEDPDTKKLRFDGLSMRIQMIEAQIAALQNQQALDALQARKKAQEAAASEKRRASPGNGGSTAGLDEYA